VRLEKSSLRLLAPAGGFPKDFVVDGHAAQEKALRADDAEKPSRLTIGTITIILINRDGRFALRIKDPQAPTRVAFTDCAGIRQTPPIACMHAGFLITAKGARHSDCAWDHDTSPSAGRGRVYD